MYRIKTVTSEGKEFMSPFVYSLKDGERKIESIKSWHKKPTLSLIPVSSWPLKNQYYEGLIDHTGSYQKIQEAEIRWQNHRG